MSRAAAAKREDPFTHISKYIYLHLSWGEEIRELLVAEKLTEHKISVYCII
jgi:hypothetical protein